jgi:MtN3 and saliva related transmembrane protein
VAGCLSTAAFVPQAWQIWKTSARDVSWAMYAVLIAGVALWIVYGLRRARCRWCSPTG